MKTTSFLSLTLLGTLLASTAVTSAAFADGSMSITNVTIDQPVTVEARVGNTVDDSVPAGGQILKKGESANMPSTNMRYYWRREMDPGTGDGKWTNWVTVDARNGDQHVSF